MLTIKQMLEAGVHFGHQTKRWNPKMKPYIFGARNGIYIIDLQKTADLYKQARQAVVDAVSQGGKVLFVGTKKQAADTAEEEAKRCGMFWINSRWLGGTMTNYVTIKKSIERLKDLEEMQTKGDWGLATKKEALKLEKELVKLQRTLGGIKDMDGLPAIMFVVDPRKERIAVHEANRLNIPVVAVTDTNCDPDPIDYLIPSNDDAIRAVKIFTGAIADAVIEGKQLFEENVRQKKSRDEALARKPIRERLEQVEAEAPAPVGVDIEIKRSRKREESKEEKVKAEEAVQKPEEAGEKPAPPTQETAADNAGDASEPAPKEDNPEAGEQEK